MKKNNISLKTAGYELNGETKQRHQLFTTLQRAFHLRDTGLHAIILKCYECRIHVNLTEQNFIYNLNELDLFSCTGTRYFVMGFAQVNRSVFV